MGRHETMRFTFLPAILLLPLLLVLAACGGGGQEENPTSTATPTATPSATVTPDEAVLIEEPKAIALQIGDVPMDFVEVEGSAMHVTNEESCASTQEAERDECLSQLEEWGRLDGYEVEYSASDPEAFLSGTYRIFGAVSIYRDQKGAAEAFRVGKRRLQEELRQLEDVAPVEIPTVGDESVAFVKVASRSTGTRDIPVSMHVVDFRQGNVLVRIGATAPTALASVDDALKLAERLDTRILQVTGRITPTASPTGTP